MPPPIDVAAVRHRPLILYIPGLKPKPEAAVHRGLLLRCLLAGLRKADSAVAADVENASDGFEIASWTGDFYGELRDPALDEPGIEALLERPYASDEDRAEAHSWQRRLQRTVYRAGDRLPFLIPRLANENMELYLRDINRYVRDVHGVGAQARACLRAPLTTACDSGRPVLLIAHSMGSMIAWDTLWQLSHVAGTPAPLGLFMTVGSPLGLHFIRKRLLGARCSDNERYVTGIRRWINVAAIGELTALDRQLANDYRPMQQSGLVESIDDYEVYNWFRYDGVLNVHAEYGYLANADTAVHVANWWREVSAANS